MSFLFDKSYYEVRANGVSPFQNMCAYLGGSAIQTVGDNPVTAYRQLVQQYAKDVDGKAVAPKQVSVDGRRREAVLVLTGGATKRSADGGCGYPMSAVLKRGDSSAFGDERGALW